MSEFEYCRRCLFCCQTHRSPRVKFIGRARDSLNKLTDRTLWQPRHPLHRIMLNCSSHNLMSLYIYTVCTICHIICTACCDATTAILRVVHCEELHLFHCTLLACGAYTNFALWTTTAVVSLTPNCFCIFFLLSIDCCSDYCFNCCDCLPL